MLPFREWAVVMHGSSALGKVRLSVWQRSEPRETPTGEVWDWSGEAEIEAAGMLVGGTNRRLYVTDSEPELPGEGETPEGRRLVVISAVRQEFLPHIDLRLAEHRGG